MNEFKIFFNRRKGRDRRLDKDPCKDITIDLYHRKRRKSTERRNTDRSIAQDYFIATNSPTMTNQH